MTTSRHLADREPVSDEPMNGSGAPRLVREILVGERRIVKANDVDLCVETFGDPADPAILLIMGAAASMDWWPDEFCRRLSDGPRYVIRYDSRDTGQSVSSEAGAPTYTSADLVEDAVGILDVLGVRRAHVVGMSMGGGIAQHLAQEHPERLASLTLFSTSPAGGVDRAGLPDMSAEVKAAFESPTPEPDWSDRAAVVEYAVTDARLFQGSVRVEEQALHDLVGRVYDRTTNIAASYTNHWILDGGGLADPRLDKIDIPTLVLHGTEDPLLPIGHGEALAALIPGGRLVRLEGVGHGEVPREVWDVVVPALLAHSAT